MDNHQLINQDSGITEYYTPIAIVEAARRVMGGIDLDPASSARANEFVKATKYFKEPEYTQTNRGEYDLPVRRYHDYGGLFQTWHGRVWMNHPFSGRQIACEPGCSKKVCKNRGWHTANPLPGNDNWTDELIFQYTAKRIIAACCITYASTSEQWFWPLLDYPQSYISPRVNYLLPDGTVKKGVTKGSVVTYLGDDIDAFRREFHGRIGNSHYYGKVKI